MHGQVTSSRSFLISSKTSRVRRDSATERACYPPNSQSHHRHYRPHAVEAQGASKGIDAFTLDRACKFDYCFLQEI